MKTLVFSLFLLSVSGNLVINTWSGVFEDATKSGYTALNGGGTALDAIEQGCSTCENEQCDTSVGFGNHPDSAGRTSLDALIMDGDTFDVGSVGYIKKYRKAISIARAVMKYTSHSMLVGDGAESFASMLNFPLDDASTNNTINIYEDWIANNCQPNFYENLSNSTTSCGPYEPVELVASMKTISQKNWVKPLENHDTIGMVAIDGSGSMACGTSTNGANHKVAGRLGDSPIVGAGCYVNSRVGGAAATGDGDVMMRFLPSYHAVLLMEMLPDITPQQACQKSIDRIAAVFPTFSGGIVCVNKHGVHGAAAYNMSFSYSFMNNDSDDVEVVVVA